MKLLSRLLPYDDVGERTDRLWGKAIGSMHLRYFEEPVDPEALREFHGHLAKGPLHRVPERTRVPGARTRWAVAPNTAELVYSTEPIALSDVPEWVDRQADATLDLQHGPTWRLTATAVEGGHTLVALRFHHAVADGLTELRAWAAAAQGEDAVFPVGDSGVVADLKDSAHQYWAAAKAAAALIRSSVRSSKEPPAAERVLTGSDLHALPETPSEFLPRRAYLEFASEDFRAAAAQRGGTANSLLVGIAARALVTTGVAPEGSAFRATQQVRQPNSEETMGNLSSLAIINVTADSVLYEDLRPVRGASKKSFEKAREHDPYRQIGALLQVLPDWIFKRLQFLAKSPTKDLCSTSNVGVLPEASITIGDARASAVYGWYLPAKTTSSERWRNHFTPIQAGLLDTGRVTSLCIEGRNPDHHSIPREKFIDILVEECARWGLVPLRAF
ncbi:MAG: hypothetical protein ACRC20_03855 [Segniliparus sp.]|uniref:hypothetical protein n=1 Tax=Segniliparus sp. TaxID=2804064 RepID=UPI003F318998